MSGSFSLSRRTFIGTAAAALIAAAAPMGPIAAQDNFSPVPAGFASSTLEVDGDRFFYYRGGKGPSVLLMHGWPQTSAEWVQVAPLLAAAGYDVIAVDLPGIGGSSNSKGDFSKKALATRIHAFTTALKLNGPHVVGHDIGGMVAFAYAHAYQAETRTVAIFDVPLPGTPLFDGISRDPRAWHFGFNAETDLAMELTEGRGDKLVSHFINRMTATKGRPTEAEIAYYGKIYSDPVTLKSGFEFYRAFAKDSQDNTPLLEQKLTMPMLGLSAGAFGPAPYVFEMLKPLGIDVQGQAIEGSGHWLAEERPNEVATALIAHFNRAK